MVSPGELRLVSELTEEGAEFEPEITDDGAVSYPSVGLILDDSDGDPGEVLDRFAARGVLHDEFVSKVYVCPECDAEGMQYTSVCPACESAHAIEMAVFEHACGYVGPVSDFEGEGEDGYSCPNCEMALQSEDLDGERRYVCQECAEVFDTPDHRLWCRDCLYMFEPGEAIERALYRYSLTDEGEQWLDRHQTARRVIAETLQERRFETEIDTTVTDESGETHPVHVLAEDVLLGERRIVSIDETPDTESVEAFRELAASVDAHPIIVTTTGTVEAGVAERAEAADLTVLTYQPDGTLDSNYEVIEDTSHHRSVFQRLTAAVDVPVWKGQ